MGASGGDMAMTADLSRHLGLRFPAFPPPAVERLGALLSDRVTVANPFDIHTYLWFEHAALRQLFEEVLRANVDAVGFVLDCPPEASADLSAFIPVIEQFAGAARGAKARAALISSLPETLSRSIRELCLRAGVVPLQGQREALEALDHAGAVGEAWQSGSYPAPRVPRPQRGPTRTLSEHAGKAALAAFGVPVPRSRVVSCAQAAGAAEALGFPVVLKACGAGLEHKSDLGAVVLDVTTVQQASTAAAQLSALSAELLVEQMIEDGVAEVLVGVIVDPQFGQVLVLGAGGVQTELWQDSVSLLPPWTRPAIEIALGRLKVARLLDGYRGKPPGDVAALVDAILAIGRYAQAHCDTLVELDVNPVIVRPQGAGAIAVDVLIRALEES
jgi:acetyl-CoA synthetase